MLPFTLDQFVAVLVTYNNAIWPAQTVGYLAGAAIVGLLFIPSRNSNRLISGLLALMWVWTGVAYHWMNFAPINPAAKLFAAFFVVQSLVFLYFGVFRDRLQFGFDASPAAWLGAALAAYAAVLYPLIGMWFGQVYPAMPMFGVTPCPVTIFTFGLLLMTTAPVSSWLLPIPFLWSLIGGSAAFLLDVPADWLLAVSGLIGVPVIIWRDHHGGVAHTYA